MILILSIYKIYYYIYNKENRILNKILYDSILNSGYVTVKFTQWLYNRYELYNYNNNFIKILNNIFENCYIHDIKHTKKIFNNSFNYNFDDDIEIDESFTIKSGSIGQVYKIKFKKFNQNMAMKVVHPNINEQIAIPYFYFLMYKNILQKNYLLKKYKLPFDIEDYFNNILSQSNLLIEADNLNYFYNFYKDEKTICIPKPIFWNKNILIMEYIDGENIFDIKCSQYIKHKIMTIFTLFIKSNFFLLDRYHADLHNYNWKIQLINNMPKIIIYDFGLCLKNSNNIKDMLNIMDINNLEEFITFLYNNITDNPLNIELETIINYFSNIHNYSNTNLFNIKFIKALFWYFTINKLVVDSSLINVAITGTLYQDNIKKYIFDINFTSYEDTIYNNTNEKKLEIELELMHSKIETNNNYKTFCNTYNCFNNCIDNFNMQNNKIREKILSIKNKLKIIKANQNLNNDYNCNNVNNVNNINNVNNDSNDNQIIDI